MYNEKNKNWIYLSIGGIVLSLASLFLPIITYTNQNGVKHPFNIIQLFGGGFAENVQTEYIGKYWIVISNSSFDAIVAIVGVIGAASIVLSFFGLRSMSKQYESALPFRMTICGLVGTMIPALLLIIAVILSKNYYLGSITLGAYVFITPITMIASCIAVVKRHQLTQQELAIQKEAAKYIRPAGDLFYQ